MKERQVWKDDEKREEADKVAETAPKKAVARKTPPPMSEMDVDEDLWNDVPV